MLKKSQYIAIGAVMILALILLNLSPEAAARLKLAVGGLFLPLFGLVGSTHSMVDRAAWSVAPRRAMIHEIERLRHENDERALAAQQAENLLRENDRLRRALAWSERSPWRDRLRLARVVGREPTTWWRTCHIDLGSREGIVPNSVVLTSDGLVGRIGAVGNTLSQVLLIGDPACGVPVQIIETRDFAVITGTSGSVLDSEMVEVTYLPNNKALMAGQRVATSGLGQIFPKGIPVGTVLDVQFDQGLLTTARVKLSADLGRLEEVWVLIH